jgi:hypothetical protein
MTRKKEKKTPIKLEQQPVQLNLFKKITTQETDSQSLRLWESLTNVIFDDKKSMNRIDGCFLKSVTEDVEFDNVKISVRKYPARIHRDGEEIEFFPLKKEYKIMEVLIKLAVDEMESCFYSSDNKWPNLGIRVSLHSIYKVIKAKTGKSKYSYTQIKEAIEILARSHISMKVGDNVIEGSLITSYTGSSLGDNMKASFLINFHPIISKLALNGGFRQFNISRSLLLPDIFTSFLYKTFVHKFKQASSTNSYHFLMENLLNEAPNIKKWGRIEKKVLKVKGSLDKLQKEGVIHSYTTEKKYVTGNGGHKKTIDCLFDVKFSKDFIDEQIRANKVKDSSIIYDDDGAVFEYPTWKNYKATSNDEKVARSKYMSDLDRWHKLSKEKEENIVHKTFKK